MPILLCTRRFMTVIWGTWQLYWKMQLMQQGLLRQGLGGTEFRVINKSTPDKKKKKSQTSFVWAINLQSVTFSWVCPLTHVLSLPSLHIFLSLPAVHVPSCTKLCLIHITYALFLVIKQKITVTTWTKNTAPRLTVSRLLRAVWMLL